MLGDRTEPVAGKNDRVHWRSTNAEQPPLRKIDNRRNRPGAKAQALPASAVLLTCPLLKGSRERLSLDLASSRMPISGLRR
ncbi:MAG: hypothetical protein DME34_04080 [Verrucomicrobia bacterium]|nr:MAG: hypothetical protein DME34_04080 [Verrucomicrobiota bacterium]